MSGWRWRGWLVAGAIFLLGIAAGGAGTAWFGGRVLRQTLRERLNEAGPTERIADRIGAELAKNLQLTPDETARVQAALDQSATNLKAVRVQAATQAGAELRASIRRIAAELPPGKRVEFYRILARRSERLGMPALAPPQSP